MIERPKIDLATAEKTRAKYRAGTPFGDEIIGTCGFPSCCRRIARHENFIVTMDDVVMHRDCFARVRVRPLKRLAR